MKMLLLFASISVLIGVVLGQTNPAASLIDVQTLANVAGGTAAVPINVVRYSPDGNTMATAYGQTVAFYSRNPTTGSFENPYTVALTGTVT